MSRAFAMWISRAIDAPVGDPRTLVSGAVLGRAPEPGDALRMVAPFALPLRVHCRAIIGAPRGAASAPFAIGIDQTWPADRLAGAILVEEGVDVKAYGGRLSNPRSRSRVAARLDLKGDRAWGLVSTEGESINIVVVGGGVAEGADFWELLETIRPEEGATIGRRQIDPVVLPGYPEIGLMRLPTLRSFARDDYERSLVVRATGPVGIDQMPLFVDGATRTARVHQQRGGLTQVIVEADASWIGTPLAA